MILQVSSSEVVDVFIERIQQVDPYLNAVVVNCFADARKEAAQIDKILSKEQLAEEYSVEKKPYLGVPFTAKEAFAIKGKTDNHVICSSGGPLEPFKIIKK